MTEQVLSQLESLTWDNIKVFMLKIIIVIKVQQLY